VIKNLFHKSHYQRKDTALELDTGGAKKRLQFERHIGIITPPNQTPEEIKKLGSFAKTSKSRQICVGFPKTLDNKI